MSATTQRVLLRPSAPILWVTLGLSAVLPACSPPSSAMGSSEQIASWTLTPPGEERALERFSALPPMDRSSLHIRRHADGQFGYLAYRLSAENRLSDRYAVDESGQIRRLSEAERDFTQAHRSTWGLLGLDSARRALQMYPTETDPFIVWYDRSASDLEELRSRAREFDPDVREYHSPDLLYLTLTKDQVIGLARSGLQSVLKVASAKDEPGQVHAVSYPLASWLPPSLQIPPSAATTFSDAAYTALERRADGVPVGIVESGTLSGAYCGIWTRHEAFTYMQYAEMNPALACEVDEQCRYHCGPAGVCSPDGFCVDRHTHYVASHIASTQRSHPDPVANGAFHAAGVSLFNANNLSLVGDHGSVNLSSNYLDETVEAYEWLLENDARIVNESYGYAQNMNLRSVITDWYARNHGMVFVQSSGNLPYGHEDPAQSRVTCAGFNSLCVGGVMWPKYAPKTQRDHADYMMWWGSGWANPVSLLGRELEIEKPDVVANAYRSLSASVRDETKWAWDSETVTHKMPPDQGVSFAAATVTGLVALYTETCDGYRRPDGLEIRSSFRTYGASGPHNLEDSTSCPSGAIMGYPAAHLGCDFRGGAGLIDARLLSSPSNCEEPPDQSENPLGNGTPCDHLDPESRCSGTLKGETTPGDPRWESIPPEFQAPDESEMIENGQKREWGSSQQGLSDEPGDSQTQPQMLALWNGCGSDHEYRQS